MDSVFDRLIGAHTIQAQLFLRESEELTQLLPGTGRKLILLAVQMYNVL